MKVKSDITIPKLSITIGVLFMLAFISPQLKLNSPVGYFYLFFCGTWLFIGIYKIESFYLKGEFIVKKKFLGLVHQTYSLNNVVSYKRNYIENDFSINPFTVLKLYNKNQKYFKFHLTIFKCNDGRKFIVDERFLDHENLPKLLKLLKSKAKDNKRN